MPPGCPEVSAQAPPSGSGSECVEHVQDLPGLPHPVAAPTGEFGQDPDFGEGSDGPRCVRRCGAEFRGDGRRVEYRDSEPERAGGAEGAREVRNYRRRSIPVEFAIARRNRDRGPAISAACMARINSSSRRPSRSIAVCIAWTLPTISTALRWSVTRQLTSPGRAIRPASNSGADRSLRQVRAVLSAGTSPFSATDSVAGRGRGFAVRAWVA